MNNLVIVESPAKAKTILKILGKGFAVRASIGHIKDLPKKELGVDVENNFKPHYVVIPGKEKIIKELKKASKEADKVFLAPDPDREGEAIAWHIAYEISDKKSQTVNEKIYRIIFNEITERAVREAIKNPEKIDMNKVDAQQARRILDRLVGYGLSPLLWRKVRRGLSAGRVQSVTVKLVVDREREIESFKSEEYWSINADFEGSKPPKFWARLYKIDQKSEVRSQKSETNNRFLIPNEETANTIVDDLKDKGFVLNKIERKLRKRMPYPPFITSTIQQEAARKLRFTAKKTMAIAQQLYEGIELGQEGAVGLITYMRTDSHRVAAEAQEWARKLIERVYGRDYIPEKPPFYKSKASAQEAHETIRPTYPDKRPEAIKQFLSKEQYALYTLIWNRFISSQMTPAQLEQTTFVIVSRDTSHVSRLTPYEFRASGTVVRFDGFMAMYTEGKDEIEEEEGLTLPALKEGETLRLLNLQPKQHFTQPPPRYTEATLVKMLEEKGIGRPSTYAAILSTVQDRKYVQKTDGKFSPTELGIVVNDFLVERFPELIDVSFTAKMEDELDRIEDGKMKWIKVVKAFYKPFSTDLTEAIKTTGRVKPKDIPTENICEKCGLPMVIRWGRHGRFLACSGFPKCKNTKPLENQEPGVNNQQPTPQQTDEVCEKCGSPMLIKSGRYGKFLACSKYPECKNTKPLSTGIKCPKDGGDIVERRSKKGKPFWSCSNYPGCKFATWYKPVSKKCPKCNADFLLEKRDKGGQTILFCHKKECGYKEVEKAPSEEAALTGVA
ncbi:MAG: type I DNA topoisomerase [Nitrospirae bacterium CG_4_10_14_0_8_um_filter_41_23]|nr:type I DNA topoisomerase [Nitrospirota bacterium]OIP60927.1 MAG: DNA topoisomerase I [Nitrospirae bacterium CG2_30_41_42]PIQ93102.1 MAG: DNA topoisomerase I [Nitrospirae bacterium CG11_big_fil_rev_8_21_14_0_20_41_14]PIV42003.1 MAG: type I DNA topoisomerase [Nitrospirae bacterium CG02_land_8_20_14_3_00_41_53]PIW86864.1 MAG: type I DNA topoisomerase [Nitrospirae bacterium CG_4_8_14_3_um_filter_41_47]PIY87404.1 MAG: type I DNA topoisomerase [Nitrospirae bacterium CG_4_10_14_0_8_um_filter_41_23